MSVNIKLQQALEAAQTLGNFLKKNLSPLGKPCRNYTDPVVEVFNRSIGNRQTAIRFATRLTYFANATKRKEERSIRKNDLAKEQLIIQSGIEMLLKQLKDINGISSIVVSINPKNKQYLQLNKLDHLSNFENAVSKDVIIKFQDGKQLVFTGLGTLGSDKTRNKRFESVSIDLDQSRELNIPRELKEIDGHGIKFNKEVKNLKDRIKSRLLEVILETYRDNPSKVTWVYGS